MGVVATRCAAAGLAACALASPAPSPLPSPVPSMLPSPAGAPPRCQFEAVEGASCLEDYRYGKTYDASAEARAGCEASARCVAVYGWATTDSPDTGWHFRKCKSSGADGCGREKFVASDDQTVYACDAYDEDPEMRSGWGFALLVVGAIGAGVGVVPALVAAENAKEAHGECSLAQQRWLATAWFLALAVIAQALGAGAVGPTSVGSADGCNADLGVIGAAFAGLAGAQLVASLAFHRAHRAATRDRDRRRAADAKRAEERARPKYERLESAAPPKTSPALVEALSKPEDVAREMERYRIWRDAADGVCPRCDGRGAVGRCDGALGHREGHLPCGCEVCFVCHGTGTTEAALARLSSLAADDDADGGDDGRPCEVCFCGSRFKMAADCDHYYCFLFSGVFF